MFTYKTDKLHTRKQRSVSIHRLLSSLTVFLVHMHSLIRGQFIVNNITWKHSVFISQFLVKKKKKARGRKTPKIISHEEEGFRLANNPFYFKAVILRVGTFALQGTYSNV